MAHKKLANRRGHKPVPAPSKRPEPAKAGSHKDDSSMLQLMSSLSPERLKEKYGTARPVVAAEFAKEFLQVMSTGGEADVEGLGFGLGMIADMRPGDPLEAALGAQMAVGNRIFMDLAIRMRRSFDLATIDTLARMLGNFARLYTAQLEALDGHRSGGKGTTPVGHVTVNDGGQAIVGNVTNIKKSDDR